MFVTSEWTEHGLSTVAGATTDVQVARGPDGTWEIVEADIYVDWVNHPWSRSGSPGLDGVSVLRHEIGHALGLLHPCELDPAVGPECSDVDRESALYPAYSPGGGLSADDEAGVCALYPAMPCGSGCREGTVCEGGVCVGCPDCDPDACSGES